MRCDAMCDAITVLLLRSKMFTVSLKPPACSSSIGKMEAACQCGWKPCWPLLCFEPCGCGCGCFRESWNTARLALAMSKVFSSCSIFSSCFLSSSTSRSSCAFCV